MDVGLPPSASGRSRLILAIQEHGAPIVRIPPRPVVGPALNRPDTRAAMASALLAGLQAAQKGDAAAARASLEQAGQAGADGIRAYIDAGIAPPNAPITVSGGWMRSRVSGKPVYVSGKGFNKPLYDTGELYASFSYEVKTKGA